MPVVKCRVYRNPITGELIRPSKTQVMEAEARLAQLELARKRLLGR